MDDHHQNRVKADTSCKMDGTTPIEHYGESVHVDSMSERKEVLTAYIDYKALSLARYMTSSEEVGHDLNRGETDTGKQSN